MLSSMPEKDADQYLNKMKLDNPNLYEDVNFSFYVSTWEYDIDYNNFKWITKWERLKEEDCPYDLKNHPGTDHAPHYT